MKNELNLIPQEMSIPVKYVNLAKKMSSFTVTLSVIAVISIISLILAIFYYNSEYKRSLSNVESIKTQIENLERNEQKLILAKDKLDKISSVLKQDSIDNELDNFKELRNLLLTLGNFRFNEVSLNTVKTEASLNFESADSLKGVLASLADFKNNKLITLASFGFNPSSGYLANLIFEDE